MYGLLVKDNIWLFENMESEDAKKTKYCDNRF